jgi:hypothetical protein
MAEKLYVIMFVDGDIVESRNTSIVGIFTTKSKARQAVTKEVREKFGALKSPIVEEEDEDQWSFFLIQEFRKDRDFCGWND